MTENKIIITHGIYKFSSFRQELEFFCRNTNKYLPLPVKFRDLLYEKYSHWWCIKTSIYRFGKRIAIRMLVDTPLEFTFAREPNTDTCVIAIVHPLDVFHRKVGVRMVKERMEYALKFPNNTKTWSHTIKREDEPEYFGGPILA